MRLIVDGRRLTARRTGVGRYLEDLLAEWSTSGPPLPETVVALADRAGLGRVPPVDGPRAQVVGAGWPGLAWERLALGRLLRPGDLLFAPANLAPATWRGPTVLVVHDLIHEALPGSFPWHVRLRFAGRYRRAAERADRILVPSRSTAADVARFRGIPAARIRVVPPGVGPAFRPSPGEAADARRALGLGEAPFFLFVGKRSRRRHLPAIVEALVNHRRAFPSHRLVLAGPHAGRGLGPDDDDLGLIDAGHVPEPRLRGLLSGALGLLYPSDYEGFGLPVVEAMACGCPVVTLRNSALIESGGDAAWYIDLPEPGRPAAVEAHRRHEALVRGLADAMRRLATDAPLRADLVARGLAHASRFRRSDFAAAVKAELIAAASGASPPP